MRFFHRLALLFLCAAVLLGTASRARAQEEPAQGRVYTVGPANELPGVRFDREIDYGVFLNRCGTQELFWSDWDSDVFAIEWSEEQFDAGVAEGEASFSIEGPYALPANCPADLQVLWDDGLITMPDAPVTTVWVRQPRDYMTTYIQDLDELPVITVYAGTSFAEAVSNQDVVSLERKDGESEYDPPAAGFLVSWSEDEYKAGMETGAESFTITGEYGGPERDDLKGWVQAEGSAVMTVVVERVEDASFQVYRNPAADAVGGTVCAAYVTPDTSFDDLYLPEEETLFLVGGTYRDTRRFAYEWSREEFEAGMALGEDAFSMSGRYAPHEAWIEEEIRLWGDGRIQVDMPEPKATIHVVREDKYPFTADIVNEGDLVPLFTFPWISGTEEATCAFSLDRETWYQETTDFEWSGDLATGQVKFTARIYDDDYDLIPIPSDGTVYVKLVVVGSALAGETDIYVLKPSADGWDMTPYDDGGGDHGGGGQGEHDRPGKEDPDDTVAPPAPDPEPEPEPEGPSDSGDDLEPEPETSPDTDNAPESVPISLLPIWPEWPPVLEVIPTPAPVPTPEPAPVVPAPSPQEEQPVLADIPIQEGPSAPPPAGGGKISMSANDAQTVMAPEAPPKVAPSPSEAATGEIDPAVAPENQTPQPTPGPVSEPPASPAPKTVPQAPAAHIPGFVVAVAVTAAVILGGAAWFHWRGKRK